MRMNAKSFLALLGAGAVLGKTRKAVAELVLLQGAICYLRAVRGARGMTIRALQVLACGIFSLSGLVLVHVALYLLLSSGSSPKAWVLLGLGLAELAPVAIFIAWFVSSKRWLHDALKANGFLEKYQRREAPWD